MLAKMNARLIDMSFVIPLQNASKHTRPIFTTRLAHPLKLQNVNANKIQLCHCCYMEKFLCARVSLIQKETFINPLRMKRNISATPVYLLL